MDNLPAISLFMATALLLSSCATSMSPSKVSSTLSNMTQSTYMNQGQAYEALETGKCSYLVRERKYLAPMSLTNKGDLKACAKVIDEWVSLDSGNAYILTHYSWTNVDHFGSSQLNVVFDTMLCD